MALNKVVISGGGTGGHIFPAVAIADEIKRRNPDAEILFVGADGKMEIRARRQASDGASVSAAQKINQQASDGASVSVAQKINQQASDGASVSAAQKINQQVSDRVIVSAAQRTEVNG